MHQVLFIVFYYTGQLLYTEHAIHTGQLLYTGYLTNYSVPG